MKFTLRAKVIIILSCLLAVPSAIYMLRQPAGQVKRHVSSSMSDLLSHPLYSKYIFSNDENIIHIGDQPSLAPANFISETMKRDMVLRNALSDLGLNIQFYSFLKGADLNFFLFRNDLQIGIAGDMPVITAASLSEIVVPILLQQGFSSIVVGRAMLLSDLAGERIGYAFGSQAHFALLNALASEGITEEQVKLIPMDISQMPDALSSGDIVAFSAWEPTPTITLNKVEGSVIIHRSLTSGFMYFSKAFWDKHPGPARQIVAASIRAVRWMRKDKQNLRQAGEWVLTSLMNILQEQNISLSLEQIIGLAEKDILKLFPTPYIPEYYLRQNNLIHYEFEFLKRLEKIPYSVDWHRVRNSFDRKIMIEVLAGPKKYNLNRFNYENILMRNKP